MAGEATRQPIPASAFVRDDEEAIPLVPPPSDPNADWQGEEAGEPGTEGPDGMGPNPLPEGYEPFIRPVGPADVGASADEVRAAVVATMDTPTIRGAIGTVSYGGFDMAAIREAIFRRAGQLGMAADRVARMILLLFMWGFLRGNRLPGAGNDLSGGEMEVRMAAHYFRVQERLPANRGGARRTALTATRFAAALICDYGAALIRAARDDATLFPRRFPKISLPGVYQSPAWQGVRMLDDLAPAYWEFVSAFSEVLAKAAPPRRDIIAGTLERTALESTRALFILAQRDARPLNWGGMETERYACLASPEEPDHISLRNDEVWAPYTPPTVDEIEASRELQRMNDGGRLDMARMREIISRLDTAQPGLPGAASSSGPAAPRRPRTDYRGTSARGLQTEADKPEEKELDACDD